MPVPVRSTVIALSWILAASICQAASVEGFLIYPPSSQGDNSQPKVIAFSDIYWLTADGGSITTMSGSTATFTSKSVTQFVYLDETYWHMMNDNASYAPFRAGILAREVVIPGEHSDITSDTEFRRCLAGSQALNALIQDAPDYAAALTSLKTQLDADAARYQNGERKLNGQWMSTQDYLSINEESPGPASKENWTTQDGKTYRNVVVKAQEEDGVRITYIDGAAKIPYYELPLELQKRFGQDYDSLEAKRKVAEKALADATRYEAERKKQQDEAAAAQLQTDQGESHAVQTISPPVAAMQTNLPPVNPPAPPVPVATKAGPPGSIYSYNEPADICYLDSPTVGVMPESASATTDVTGRQTLSLRITTAGSKPEIPEKIEVFFLSTNIAEKTDEKHDIKFVVDGTSVPVEAIENTDEDVSFIAGHLADCVAFYLSPEQARSIFHGKKVTFCVENDTYRIDQDGIYVFRRYLVDVNRLPPAPTHFLQAYHSLVARLPSLVEIISKVCEYVVFGVVLFALGVVLTVAVLWAFTFFKI